MKRVIDPRLHEGPKVWKDKDSVRLSFKVNTPFRISFVYYNLVQPSILLWRLTFTVLLIDLMLWFGGVWSLFFYLTVERSTVYLVMIGALLVWQVEQASRYSLNRWFLGKWMHVRITREHVYVGPCWPFRKQYDRSYQLMFGIRRFEGGQEPAYRNAHGLYLVIDDTTRIKLTEIFDPLAATRIVTVCNMALRLTDEMERYDVDPTEKQDMFAH